jgi:MYXO-CTERM domain-containing protein
MTADDLALLAHRLYRRSYLHDPFRSCSRRGGSGGREGHRYHAPGAQTFAHQGLAGPSATKQNTKRSRRAIRPLSAVLRIALAAFCSAVSTASADPSPAPVLVHSTHERDRATSVAGSGIPGTGAVGPTHAVYARRADGWIQYWIWFEDNRQDRGVLRSGRHAGDWELVQYREDGSEAVYAQHSGAERCGRRDIEFRGERPVVYVANGSHAAYFHAGVRDRTWPDPNDEADGRGAIQRPIAVSVSEAAPPWMRYRGRWGGARAGWFPPEQSSPRGPAFQGERWDDPEAFARAARPCTGRRCVAAGACDGAENAVVAGLAAALLALAGLGWWRRRRRTSTTAG